MTEYRRIEVDGQRYYGKHLIASCRQCAKTVKDKDVVSRVLHRLALDIDMKPFGQPIVERFGEGIEVGLSGVQLIETSAITVHTNDMACDLYLDVFSCKWFDEQQVLDWLETHFQPREVIHQVLLRP